MRQVALSLIVGLALVATNAVGQESLPAADDDAAVKVPKTVAKLRSGEPVRIVCFSDSVTGVYYHTGGRRAYADMLDIALGRVFPKSDVTMINAGISGHTTVNALSRIDRDVLAHEPTLVTVMFGLNDMGGLTLDQYRDLLRTIVEKCRSAGAEVLLATPNDVINTSGRPTEKLQRYCEAMRDVGQSMNVPVCDCYSELEALKSRDAAAWRLLLSDEIHPNMDGHKRIAELLARSISGRETSLADVPPPARPLAKSLALIKSGRPVKILAMPPFDEWIGPALSEIVPDAQLEIMAWPTAGKTLSEIEQDAKARVRPMKPDLVMIAVPRKAMFESEESFISGYTWIMNWSLSFAMQEWDCVAVHPAVVDSDHAEARRDALVRQLVGAQDLTLIDRSMDERQSGKEIFVEWLKRQVIQ
jgi:lysophospholipase L1-like esterase